MLDLAAGTGKLSHAIAATGAEVVAVEPVAEMRAAIGPGVRAMDGAAEAIPLRDGAVDAVTVGQAFHWFDGDAALAEIHRVLRDGGGLALLWNVQAMENPIHAAIEKVIAPHVEGVPRHRVGTWRAAFESTTLFGPLEEAKFAHEQRLDAEGLVARVGSISAVAAMAQPDRSAVLDRVRALADPDRAVTLPYVCRVQVADRI